jgi:hypothetical protein
MLLPRQRWPDLDSPGPGALQPWRGLLKAGRRRDILCVERGPTPNSQPADGASQGGVTSCHFFQMADIVEVSRTSTLELQNQLDEYKEKNRRELAEMQRQVKEKTLEAEKARLATMKMQDEVMPAQMMSYFIL